jgi:hypothetical protein
MVVMKNPNPGGLLTANRILGLKIPSRAQTSGLLTLVDQRARELRITTLRKWQEVERVVLAMSSIVRRKYGVATLENLSEGSSVTP